MGVSGKRHTPAALYPRGKGPRYKLDRTLGGPLAGLDAESRRKILCPCRGSNPQSSSPQSITILTKLTRLHKTCCAMWLNKQRVFTLNVNKTKLNCLVYLFKAIFVCTNCSNMFTDNRQWHWASRVLSSSVSTSLPSVSLSSLETEFRLSYWSAVSNSSS
jgi:hypothetical protein